MGDEKQVIGKDKRRVKRNESQSVSNFLRPVSLSIIAIASFILLTGIQPAYATLYDRAEKTA